MEYRKLTDLTDEEISIIIKEIFPNTRKVDHIERDENANFPLSCDIYIMEEYPDYADTLDLSPTSMSTHDFTFTDEELWKWRQRMLAEGCNPLLEDNPYLKTEHMVTEWCSECEYEVTFEWNVEEYGYAAYCPHCGAKLMLCSECPLLNKIGNCSYNSNAGTCSMDAAKQSE